MDIRTKQQQNVGQQKFTVNEAEHVHRDMMGRQIEARIQVEGEGRREERGERGKEGRREGGREGGRRERGEGERGSMDSIYFCHSILLGSGSKEICKSGGLAETDSGEEQERDGGVVQENGREGE